MIDERHPLYLLALSQLALPMGPTARVGEPPKTVPDADAPAVTKDDASAERRRAPYLVAV